MNHRRGSDRDGERYSHCLCLHVKPASLFIGIYFFITSVLNLIKLSSGYNIRTEDNMRRFIAVNRPTTTLLLIINLTLSGASAMLIYGVTKSKASHLMPFFGMQLYHFLFSLPSSLSHLNISTNQYRHHYGNSPVTSPAEVRNILRTDIDNTTYTFSVLVTLIDFLCDIYFICVVWRCYRYLKLKEIASTLTLPYNLDLEIVVPSEVVSSTNVTPPDYETAIKDNPPPDYESAIKFQAQNQVSGTGDVNTSNFSAATTTSSTSNGDQVNSSSPDHLKSNNNLTTLSQSSGTFLNNNNNFNNINCGHSSITHHCHSSSGVSNNNSINFNATNYGDQQQPNRSDANQFSEAPPPDYHELHIDLSSVKNLTFQTTASGNSTVSIPTSNGTKSDNNITQNDQQLRK